MSAGSRRWLGRVALLAVSTALALLLAEGALRVLDVAPARFAHPWHLETEDKRLGLDVYPDDPRDYFPLDLRDEATRAEWSEMPELAERWERTPHAVPFRYSPELCRGGDIEPAGERARVVVIGDSFTEGQGVREADTYAARLDAELDAQVLNCGRRGYDFPRIHEWFDLKLEQLAPTVVVYGMILNDAEQSDAFRAEQEFIDDWILDRRRMFMDGDGSPPRDRSRLALMIEDRIEGWRVGEATTEWYRGMVGPANQRGWDATLEHLAQMHESIEARGGHLLVVLWPLMVELDGEYPFEQVHRTIGAALEARGVHFVDSLPAFRGRDPVALWVHPTDRHPNERAHALFAAEVAEALRPMLRDPS